MCLDVRSCQAWLQVLQGKLHTSLGVDAGRLGVLSRSGQRRRTEPGSSYEQLGMLLMEGTPQ